MRVAEHNKKLLRENVELREDSKKLQKIMAEIGEETIHQILHGDKRSLRENVK